MWMKRIPGASKYLVSREGKVFSFYTNRFLRSRTNYYGYKSVGLTFDGVKSKNYPLHRIMAMAWLPNPNNYPIVRHLNDIKQDNRLINLCWGTHTENRQDAVKNGRNNDYKHHLRKLSPDQVRHIRRSQETHKSLGELYGVHPSAISRIRTREQYSDIK